MKEIKIVLNNNMEQCLEKQFSVFIDGDELQNVEKFSLVAKAFTGEDLRKGGFFNFVNVIKYSVDYFAPYFEEEGCPWAPKAAM